MRYRSIALIQPKSRTSNSGYLVPHRKHAQHKTKVVHSSSSSAKKGSGVIEDADMLYMKQKEQGQGLKLAGQGLNPAGGAVMIESSGQGLDLPGGSLRASLLGSIPKKPKKKIIQSVMTDDLSKKSYPLGEIDTVGGGKRKKKMKKMRGRGDPQSGVGSADAENLDKIQNVLSTNVIPKLMKKMDIHNIVPQSLIDKVVQTSTSNPDNTIKDVIVELSKKIMPIVTQSELAKSGVTSGGAYKKIIKSKKYKKLHGDMAKYLHAKINGQSGSGFFGDLWNGLKSIVKKVIQPIAKVVGPVASFLLPEFAPAIGVATSVIGSI